jgi:protein-S-isoprenylcysteine O-methyltransferase Ste14
VRRPHAALGATVFFVAAPGVVAGLIPWWLTDGWRAGTAPWPVRALGAVLLVAGVVVLIDAFVRFVREGGGTPAPVAPTERLVVGGLYRYVRNPMYVAVASVVVGQALLLGRWVLLAYVVVPLVATVAFVRFYEEPTLLDRYGDQYAAYRRAVPGWWPRLTPWTPDGER